MGKSQVIRGFDDNSNSGLDVNGVNADLSDDLVGARYNVTAGGAHFQVPLFVDTDDDPATAAQFTTLYPADVVSGDHTITGDESWISTRAIGDIVKDEPTELNEIIAAIEATPYKTLAFGVLTSEGGSASVKSITFKDTTYTFKSDPVTSRTVNNADVRDEETSNNYKFWHQGYDNATARHQVTADGLELVGKSQVIKGYNNNSANVSTKNVDLATELLDGSYTVAEGSDNVFFQVPVFFDNGSGVKFATLRSAGKGAGKNMFSPDEMWQSSKALGDIDANTDAPLSELIAALGDYKAIGFGVLTNEGETATVSNVTFDGVSYDFADAPNLATTDKTVKERDIAPNESSYAGWHQGAASNSARIDDGKLKLGDDRSQIIKGYANNDQTLNTENANLRQVLRSASFDVESGTVLFQIPMFFEDPASGDTKFTTLRPTAAAQSGTNTFSLGQQWTSSKAITGVLEAGESAMLGDILSALPNYKVLAFGVYADAGAQAVVNSISWDGVKYGFADANPTAGDIAKSTRANDTVEITLEGADAEDDVTYTLGTNQAAHGTVVLEGNKATYTPEADFAGTDTFSYEVSDGGFDTAEGTVTVTVTENGAPVVTPGLAGSVRSGGNSAATVDLTASDPDGDDIESYDVVGQSPDGFAAIFSGTRLVVVPLAEVAATEDQDLVVQVTATDSRGKVSAPADVTITVKANRAPTAPNVTANTAYNTAVEVALNSEDPERDTITYSATVSAAAGTVSAAGNKVTFTPKSGFTGQAVVGYTATDAREAVGTGTITITVAAKPNTAPTAPNLTATTAHNTPVKVELNSADAEDDAITYTATVSADAGTVSVAGNKVTFTPKSGFTGQAVVAYKATDARDAVGTGSITIAVAAKPNTAPTAGNVRASTAAGKAVVATLVGNDVDGDPLTYTAIVAASQGKVVVSGNTVTFTPKSGFAGAATVSYTVADGRGATATGMVSVAVARAKTTLSAKTTTSKVKTSTKVKIAVTAKAPGAVVDGAKVTITSGSKTLGHGTVKSGKVTISIGKLKKGTSTIKVAFPGTDSATSATDTLKIKVKK